MIQTESTAEVLARGIRLAIDRRGWRTAAPVASFVALAVLAFPASASAQEAEGRQAVVGNPCMQCHDGIAGQEGMWNGRRFTHTPHVERARLDCTFCHTPIERHGGMKLESVAACNDCHHNRTSGASCSRCHQGGVGAPKGIISHEVGDFGHGRHTAAGLSCTACHSGSTMSAASVQCAACHTAHHRPESGCVACHRAGTTPTHPVEIHDSGCTACHGEDSEWIDHWTREVCSVCHTDRSGHYPERPCSVCHIVPPIHTGAED